MATILDYRLDPKWLPIAHFVVGRLVAPDVAAGGAVRAAVMMMPGSTVIWYYAWNSRLCPSLWTEFERCPLSDLAAANGPAVLFSTDQFFHDCGCWRELR